MRYKPVGLLNIFIGSLLTIYTLWILFIVIPQSSALHKQLNINIGYEQSSINIGPFTIDAKIYLVSNLIAGLLSILLGAKLLSKPKDIYFKIGVIFLVLYLAWWVLGIIHSVLINVNPPDLIQ